MHLDLVLAGRRSILLLGWGCHILHVGRAAVCLAIVVPCALLLIVGDVGGNIGLGSGVELAGV